MTETEVYFTGPMGIGELDVNQAKGVVHLDFRYADPKTYQVSPYIMERLMAHKDEAESWGDLCVKAGVEKYHLTEFTGTIRRVRTRSAF